MDNNLAFTMHAGNKEFGQGNDEAENQSENIQITLWNLQYLRIRSV